MQLGPNNEQIWRGLAPLRNGANRLVPKSAGVNVLAMTAAQEPLLLGWDTGLNRVLALGVSDTWRWWTHGQAATHQRFWEQLLLWLARMENESDQPVWVRVNPRNFAPGDRVIATFGAQDEQKQPIPEARYTVEVVAPDGRTTLVPAQKVGAENIADFSGLTEPGDYQVLVTARLGEGGTVYGAPARTRFIVDARDAELDNPAADPGLMAEIATITGAVPVPPENAGAFLEELLREGLETELTRYTQVNLWDGWPLLLLFVLMLATEWFLRKRRGMV